MRVSVRVIAENENEDGLPQRRCGSSWTEFATESLDLFCTKDRGRV